MKQLLYFFAILTLVAACQKKNVTPPELPPDFWGTVTAEKNGQLWTGHPACLIDIVDNEHISIHLDSFFEGSRLFYIKESLTIAKIPPKPGTSEVKKAGVGVIETNSRFSYWNYDELLGIYNILESDSTTNLVTLESYDTLTKEIRGTFNLTYLVAQRPYANAPDTIRFRNGKFHGKLYR